MDTEHYELDRADEKCLHMASIFFQTRLERVRAKNTPPPRGPRLTRRERECLSWVASGKTDWEISQILSIAEQTVHEYVQNALIKLNATTRAQAVAVAIYTKQIAL
jgi:DNA-binding CsgD family transcriptional regulator